MKEPPLRKTSALQGGLPANRRVQEITVVQHYHPNPMRPKMGNFPEVHFNELPDGSRYLHLHPVFKFVDNFLSSTSVTSKSVPGGRQHIATKKRSPGKLVRNCECTPNDIVNNVGGDSVAKAFITKKSKMPHRTSNQNLLKNFKQERMKTNLSNMSSKSNIRVSLRGAPCMNWSRCGDNAPVHKNIEKTERSANSMGKGSEYYIEQLKNEIKESNSRTQFCRMTPRNDNYEYVDKLKDELSCTQSRCLEDARKIIDELKTEIVNYRLHAKTKYSSSCSDIASSEKALQSTIISGHKMGEYPPVERSEIYDKQGDVPHPSARDSPTRDLTQRCRPCETLWQSKGSLPSSSDLEMVPVAQDINFEEKLEEANSLIEKVRKALKDIGKGIYKVPEHKRAHGDADEPVRQCSENVRCVDMVCSFHGQCRTLVNQNGEAVKEQKTVAKEQIQESKAQAPQADTKSDVKIEVEEKQQIREEVAKEKQQIREEGVNESITPDVEQEAAEKHLAKPVNDEGKESPRDTSGDEFVVKKTEDKKFVTPSMEMLQEKLQAISEVSESDASTEKPVEQKRPVPRMERGSSPIDLTRGKVEAGDEVSDPNAGSPNRHSFVQTWTEGTVTQQPFLQMLHSDTTISESSRSVAELAPGIKKNASGSEVNSSAPEGTQSPDAAKTYESGGSSRRGSNQRSSKLSIQMMPPVNIRGGLVMQRTLNLCIKPTGSVTNDLSVDQGNIGYEEITTDGAGEKWAEPEKSIFVKCPDDCKNPTTEYCKYKSAEYEDVDLNNGTNEIKDENTNEVLSRCSEETDGVVLIKPAMSNASREKPRSSHQETCSGRTPKITASGGLNEDALLLFRSFQILDDEKYQNRRESQFSLATLTQNIARSVLNTDPVNTPQKRLEQLARIENASETLRLAMSESSAVPTIYTAPSDSQRVKKIIHVGHRTPWEIGFYQTKSTQCSQTYLAPKETSVAKSNPVPVAQPNPVPMAQPNPVPVAKPKSAEALTRTSSADEMPKTSTAEASPVSGSASSSPRSSTASQPVTSPDRTPLSRSHYSDESTSRSSEPTPVTKNTDHVQSTDPVLPTNDEIREEPVKDITQHRSHHHHQISMADILSILKGGKENANVSVSGSMDNASFMSKQHKTSVTVTPTADGTILRSNESSKDEVGKSSPNNKSSLLALPVANTEDNAKSAHNTSSTSSSSNDSVTKGSVIHGTPTTMSKKSAKEFSSSSSTSSSSSNADVHKSVHSSSAETMTHTQNGVKRKHTSDSGVHDDSVKTVQSIRDEEKRSVPYVKTDSLEKENDVEVKEPKPKHKEPAVDVEHEVSKETKPADPKVQKVDANLQVSLDSSTGSASSSDTSFYSHRERLNTIAYFIKGLTGTSQDELDKLRSNPSFPKTDLPNWSKTVLKTLQEQNALPRPSLMSDKTKEEMSKRSMYEVTRERVMDTTDYGDRSGGESKQRQPEDAESVLSDNTKMKRLREFQKFAQQAQGKASRDTKASKSKVVMTVAEEIGDVGEKSDDLVSYSKRNLPFYRRVLGRILEPSNRKPMQTSQSDANPVDESVSEGEIKCKSSASIGEVAPRKYPNERKKSGKGGVKYLKKHPEDLIRKELSDKSLRIARQRTQYNNWVTYYLQKHNNMPLIDDSSSMSPDSSKK